MIKIVVHDLVCYNCDGKGTCKNHAIDFLYVCPICRGMGKLDKRDLTDMFGQSIFDDND